MNYVVISPDDWSMADTVDNGVSSFLFLDFDDVLNFFPRDYAERVDDYHPNRIKFKYRKDSKHKYTVHYDVDVLDTLNTALNDSSVQLVWLTSWRDSMVYAGHKMDIHGANCPVVLNHDQGHHTLTKIRAMNTVLASLPKSARGGVRIAWLDDKVCANFIDLTYNVENRKLFVDFDAFLAMAPQEDIGLLLPQAIEVRDFLLRND